MNKFWSEQLVGRISRLWSRTKLSSSSSSGRSKDGKKLQNDLQSILASLSHFESDGRDKEADAGYSQQKELCNLFEKIQQATQRSLNNQRVDPSAKLQHELDVASLGALIDRLNKTRLKSQECISNSEQLGIDISELVAKSSSFFKIEQEYDQQRFELPPDKERDMFLFNIYSKINRQSARRMDNQDAEIQPSINTLQDQENDQLFSLVYKASKSKETYADQRFDRQ